MKNNFYIQPIQNEQQAMEFFHIGRDAMKDLAKRADAKIKIGHNVRYDVEKMLAYVRKERTIESRFHGQRQDALAELNKKSKEARENEI